jgi:hypothetical protein
MPDLAERLERALRWCLTACGLPAAGVEVKACAAEAMVVGQPSGFNFTGLSVCWGRAQQRLYFGLFLVARVLVCVLCHADQSQCYLRMTEDLRKV